MLIFQLVSRVKGGESEGFRIDSGVRQGCIMSLWIFNVYRKQKICQEQMSIAPIKVAGFKQKLLLLSIYINKPPSNTCLIVKCLT